MLQKELLEGLAQRLYESESARQRVIETYQERCRVIPDRADAALVMGTSFGLYPDKFKKRVFTGSQLLNLGKVSYLVFSGMKDHETNDTNQAEDARLYAVTQFGVDDSRVYTVGGNNTLGNLVSARELLEQEGCDVRSIYVVSNGTHLMRTLPAADSVFKPFGVKVHPFPVPGEIIDPNHPKVTEDAIKALLYNRTTNKTQGEVDPNTRLVVDEIAERYTKLARAMPKTPEIPFEEWQISVESVFRAN